ncbi:MAG: MFS transporter [Deltaproteobacteria bacterium]|nr:MFS transporter [Deltaproteobacteria bacterium]
MGWADLFRFGRQDIAALHKTWFAYFLTFVVWFNMAPLATTIVESSGLSAAQLKLLALCNVALTSPSRFVIGMLTDRFGPRRIFSGIMVAMSLPCFVFAFSDSYTQMLASRLILSMVGTGFVVGMHMTSLWFKPRDIGFAQGVEAGLGNWGASIAAILLPVAALNVSGSWRYAAAASGLVMLLYGLYYRAAITDGPAFAACRAPVRNSAIEVCTWRDMISAILWTIPVTGVLGVVVWKLSASGFLSAGAALAAYAVIAAVVFFHALRIFRFNYPLLKKGVPDADRYRFADVGALCLCYGASFGAELGVISMLPQFFEKNFSLTPQLAGLVGASFAFMNFFSRAFGGYISERSPSKRGAVLVFLAGIAVSFGLMGLIEPSWPLWLAVGVTILCALFVTGACGATYTIVPLVKRRMTGHITGYVGAFGGIGAVLYLTAYTFVSDSQFFHIMGAGALFTFVFCVFFLREPSGAFSQEYQITGGGKAVLKGRTLARGNWGRQ